jgi:hypothetical protein
MAAILSSQSWPAWLGEEPAHPARLKSILAPYPSEEMTGSPVSLRVGNAKNNDPSLIELIAVRSGCFLQDLVGPAPIRWFGDGFCGDLVGKNSLRRPKRR